MKRSINIKNKFNNYILILSLIAQILLITASSPMNYSFDQTSVYEAVIARSLPFPYNSSPIRYYLSSITDKEPMADIGRNQYILRRMMGGRGFTHHYIKIFPYIGLSVLMLCFGHVINRKKRSKALIAFNLGGHAPPFRMRLAYMNI